MVLRYAKTVPGDRDFSDACSWVLLWEVHLQGYWPGSGYRDPTLWSADRADRDHGQPAAEGVFVPHVPVRRWLRGRTAVRPRRRQRWAAAGVLHRGPVR